MKLVFWGTRGSIPVSGKTYVKYGGNTPSILLEEGDNSIILDAGSGIRPLGNYLIEKQRKNISLIITHAHWDHIQGLPFFLPFYIPEYKIDLYFTSYNDFEAKDIIYTQMQNCFFPVSPDEFQSNINYHTLSKNDDLLFSNWKVSSHKVHHSVNTTAYKFKNDKFTLVYMTDNELYYDTDIKDLKKIDLVKSNKELIAFCEKADYLIHDTMYLHNNYASKIGWGHSDNIAAAYFAHQANVKNFVLFHYSPEYDDNNIDLMFKKTNDFLKEINSGVKCIASYDGLTIDLQENINA